MNLLQPNIPAVLTTLAIFAALLAAVGWFIWRVVRRITAPPPREPRERERLVEIAERVEQLAEETRRLDEAQRFTTAVLVERHNVRDES